MVVFGGSKGIFAGCNIHHNGDNGVCANDGGTLLERVVLVEYIIYIYVYNSFFCCCLLLLVAEN